MTDPGVHHHVEIKEGDETVAAADVTIPSESEGTAQASLRAAPGHVPPGHRASLVDAVMDLPEVQESTRLEAALPLGDSQTLARLRERSDNATTRAAGSSALVDADIPPGTGPDVPPGTGPDVPPGTGPDVPPGTGPDVPPGTGPDVPPGTGPDVPPGTGPDVPPGTGPDVPPATEQGPAGGA